MSINKLLTILKGGSGSGNFGHIGRPGKVGGSTSNSIAGYANVAWELSSQNYDYPAVNNPDYDPKAKYNPNSTADMYRVRNVPDDVKAKVEQVFDDVALQDLVKYNDVRIRVDVLSPAQIGSQLARTNGSLLQINSSLLDMKKEPSEYYKAPSLLHSTIAHELAHSFYKDNWSKSNKVTDWRATFNLLQDKSYLRQYHRQNDSEAFAASAVMYKYNPDRLPVQVKNYFDANFSEL